MGPCSAASVSACVRSSVCCSVRRMGLSDGASITDLSARPGLSSRAEIEVLDLKPTRELPEKSGSFVTNFSQADPWRRGWDGDFSYGSLCALATWRFSFQILPDPNAKSQRRQAAKIQQGDPDRLHHVGILPEKTRLICHRFRWYERLGSATVSKTSRSAWEVRRRRQLATCCGWSRTTQPRSALLTR